MTQEQKELFETSISIVHNSPSSIFTEQDVVKVLTDLQRSIDELPKADATSFTKEQIINSVKSLLNEYSFEEFISCEPELNGSYGDSYSLEMNTSFEEREFTRSFITELEDYFTHNEEQLK
jgi:hypothetical protein